MPVTAPAGSMAGVTALLRLTARLHAAGRADEIGFIACNELRQFAAVRQVALVRFRGHRGAVLVSHSGLAQVEQDAPYARWIADVARVARSRFGSARPGEGRLTLHPEDLPASLAPSWSEWLPAHLVAWPFAGPDGRPVAMLLAASDTPLPVADGPASTGALIDAAVDSCSHAWWAMAERRGPLLARLRQVTGGRTQLLAFAAALVLMAVPVRDYALVPAEVVSTDSQVIASPRDGVIRRMAVAPNAAVQSGDVLATLDDTTLENRLAVARGALATARLELHQASQRAIESQTAKAELHLAAGRVREREIEVESLQREIDRLAIRAPAAGVFVYTHPDEWAGRPVRTGERIGLLANPLALGIQAWAPVNESVNLRPGAAMTVFLRVAPLHPVSAHVEQSGYQAVEAPDGTASYSLRGPLDSAPGGDGPARIGLRGTARVAGDWTTLGYLLLRRPIATLREWCGC